MSRTVVALDTETHLIGPGAVAPKMVCITFAGWPEFLDAGDELLPSQDLVQTNIFAACDPDTEAFIRMALEDKDLDIVGHNMAYDMGVIAATYPKLLPLIFKAYNEQRIHCTIAREKLLNLSTTGEVDWRNNPDGSRMPIKYNLKVLAQDYLGEDMSADKDKEDSWRLNYSMLEGKRIEEYPEEAKEYAMRDSRFTLAIHALQEEKAKELGASLVTHEFQAAADFALFLTTCHGIAIDEEARKLMEEALAEELAPEKTALLTEAGILDPGTPPKQKKDGTFTKGKPPSIKQAPLAELVKEVCEMHGIPVKETPGRVNKQTGEREPGISCDAEVMDNIAHLHPVLEQYQHRQKLQKLVTTEIPRIQAPIIHPCFDVLKETGRTSSRASDLFPSCNIQNVDPRVRPCYVPRPGQLMLSVDYSAIELVTEAQRQLDIFGHSVLADIINSGGDPHGYLGAQMAYQFDDKWREAADANNCNTRDDIYKMFMLMKKDPDQEIRAFFKKYRTFAKPTGLGYPGGLGAETFVTYAKATYGVIITVEEAQAFKLVWQDSLPEGQMALDYVTTSLQDPNSPSDFAYTTPLGMRRARCSYCAAANGFFLQSPAAEGGKLAYYTFVEACYTKVLGREALYGCRPLAWIHDEILCEIPDDEFSHERALEVSRIMVECMQTITPDVQVRTEPKLMRRWYKEAEPVYVDGRLVPWEPS